MPTAAPLQYFSSNPVGRDWVVGDIHGCFRLLEMMLPRIGFDKACDRLFSLGDLIDRGPQSQRVGGFLDAPWFFAIRGNHEQMLLDAMADGWGRARARRLWQLNGGSWFDRLGGDDRTAITARIASLPYAIEVELADGALAGLIHADVVADAWPLTRERLHSASTAARSEIIWGRDRAHALQTRLDGGEGARPIAVAGIDWVAFGHTPIAMPVACANTRWLDTGAAYGNRLSIAELDMGGEVWSLTADGEDLVRGWRHC